jgi:hypothetical protein
MKFLLSAIALLFVATGVMPLAAQTNAAPSVMSTNLAPANSQPVAGIGAKEYAMISFLTPEEQQKYAAARAKALTNDPALAAEGDELKQEAPTLLKDGTAADQQAFLEKMRMHRQKLREAMLKEDSTLQPIFAEIDKHISAARAKQLSQVDGSASGTNAPSATPPAQP